MIYETANDWFMVMQIKPLMTFFLFFHEQDSLIANLLRLIKKMKPKSKQKPKGKAGKSEPTWDEREAEEESKKSDRDINKQLFPALAMPNDPHIRVCLCHTVCHDST